MTLYYSMEMWQSGLEDSICMQDPKPAGRIEYVAPRSKPNDYIVFKAEMDLVLAFSSCPQDIIPVSIISVLELCLYTYVDSTLVTLNLIS